MARTGADEATAPATSWGYWVEEKLSYVTIVTINLQLLVIYVDRPKHN